MDTHSHPEISQMQVQLAELQIKYSDLDKRTERHETILITGTDEQVSLPETVRALSMTVNLYIKRKNQEEDEKKKEWNRWKWVILGTVIPGTLVFIVQAVIFFFRFMPIMVSLADGR